MEVEFVIGNGVVLAIAGDLPLIVQLADGVAYHVGHLRVLAACLQHLVAGVQLLDVLETCIPHQRQQLIVCLLQGILHRIRALCDLKETHSPSAGNLIELQYEVMNLAFQQEVVTKVADKSSNAIQTLIKNQ